MIEGHNITLVIPCHNEATGLQSLLPRVPAGIDEVLVVDNNSTDDTVAVARRHGARVISATRPGYGAAYQAGFAAVTTELIATLDGDDQYPIQAIPRLATQLITEQLDFISGCRFPLTNQSMPPLRQVGNHLLTAAARLLFRCHLQDTQSGMWVFRRRLLHNISCQQPGMAFSEELKLKVILAGLAFAECHISYYPRRGRSKLWPFTDGYRNLLYLLRLRLECGIINTCDARALRPKS